MKTNVKNYRKIIIIALPLLVSLFSFLVPYFIFSSFISNRLEKSHLENTNSLVDASASEISLLWKNMETYGSTFHFINEENIESYIEFLLEKEEIEYINAICGDKEYKANRKDGISINPIGQSIDATASGYQRPDSFFSSEKERCISFINRKEESSLEIGIKTSAFLSLLPIYGNIPSAIYIVDSEGYLITEKWNGFSAPYTMRMSGGLAKIIAPFQSIRIEREIEDTPFSIAFLLDKNSIEHSEWELFPRFIILSGIILLLSVLSVIYLYRSICTPTKEMKEVVERIANGEYSARINKKDMGLLGDLSEEMNSMIKDIDERIQKTLIAELREKEAENKALQAQIQPHFLFNTINNLIALLYQDDMEKLEKSLYQFSDLLHYVMRKESSVTLGEELTFLDDYLSLQSLRFSTRMTYQMMIQESTKEVEIPRLLLQPFVENAILHGIEPKKTMTTLLISSQFEGDDVVIIIRDNGVGFDVEKTDITKRIGSSNSMERLKLKYEGSSTTISSNPGKGCTVRIYIKGAKLYENSNS